MLLTNEQLNAVGDGEVLRPCSMQFQMTITLGFPWVTELRLPKCMQVHIILLLYDIALMKTVESN